MEFINTVRHIFERFYGKNAEEMYDIIAHNIGGYEITTQGAYYDVRTGPLSDLTPVVRDRLISNVAKQLINLIIGKRLFGEVNRTRNEYMPLNWYAARTIHKTYIQTTSLPAGIAEERKTRFTDAALAYLYRPDRVALKIERDNPMLKAKIAKNCPDNVLYKQVIDGRVASGAGGDMVERDRSEIVGMIDEMIRFRMITIEDRREFLIWLREDGDTNFDPDILEDVESMTDDDIRQLFSAVRYKLYTFQLCKLISSVESYDDYMAGKVADDRHRAEVVKHSLLDRTTKKKKKQAARRSRRRKKN